ncbi:CRISPR type I-E protein CasA/Cse1 [Kiritimatiella glycovorans]|uniref:CRISPR type I-E protein CasA/Cse1 n=2 Tax=Kiritimatiella glycovorans TaxID=1307763 RepID=A0A0G3EIT4_9BACT|nr:CRISPR type I-E protein CasA/Cse1 [Kiritimatiella glycovorans]
MNLITDPWIPIIFANGQSEMISLDALYRDAEKIHDLGVNPPQRIALMRMLLCITQAALAGPEDEQELRTCRNRIRSESRHYLFSRAGIFDLYGHHPFLQIPGLSADREASLDKLFETSIGENPIFLGQRAEEGRRFTDAQKALALLVFQNFSAGGKIGQSVWAGVRSSESTFAAPCFNNLYLYIRGENLLGTLWLNLLPKSQISTEWGTPVWEFMPKSPNDDKAFYNAYSSYLGRTTPLTRLVLLHGDGEDTSCIIGPVPKKYVYSNEAGSFRDPYVPIRYSAKGSHRYINVEPSKHVWRELASILALHNKTESLPPCNLLNLEHAGNSTVDIWCGGLAMGARAAKIYDMAEWTFSFPASFLGKAALAKYAQGTALASKGEATLKKAVQGNKYSYAKMLNSSSRGYFKTAALRYWSVLDSKYQMLVSIASASEQNLDAWKRLLHHAMHSAFKQSCPHETPRQIQAYARAIKLLKLEDREG